MGVGRVVQEDQLGGPAMTELADLPGLVDTEVMDEQPFFAPAATDMLDGLLGQYRRARQQIAEVAAFAAGEVAASVLHYFLDGNASESRGRQSLSNAQGQLFNV